MQKPPRAPWIVEKIRCMISGAHFHFFGRVEYNNNTTNNKHILPPGVYQWGQPGPASCTGRCGTAHLATAELSQAFAQTALINKKRKWTHLKSLTQKSQGFSSTTHMGGGILIAEHVGVRGQNRRPWLLRHTGGLRSCFAVVYQLLHGVCDAFITRQPGRRNIQLVLNCKKQGCKRRAF